MNPEASSDPYSTWDAAYVLGALSTADRLQFEQHLRSCAPCSTAVTALAGMPQLLNFAPAAAAPVTAPDAEVPGAVLMSLLAAGRRRRRRRQLVLTGLLSAASVLALVVGLTVSHRSGPVQPVALPLVPVNAQLASVPIQASVRLAAEPWGTRLEVSCTYEDYPAGGSSTGSEPRRYQLIVTDRAGRNLVAGGWSSGASRTIWPTATVPLAPADISSVAITTGQDVPLLQWKR